MQINKQMFPIFLIISPIFEHAETAWLIVLLLILGNLILGIVKGVNLTIVSKTNFGKSVLLLITGNYVSWIIGNLLLSGFQDFFIDLLLNLKFVFVFWIISLLILYLFIVFIEVPFYRWSFPIDKRKWSQSIKISFIINAFTFALMIFFYVGGNRYSFFSQLSINQKILEKNRNLDLYFIKGTNILKCDFNDIKSAKKLFQIPDSIKNPKFALLIDTSNNSVKLNVVNHKRYHHFLDDSFITLAQKKYFYKFSNAVDFRDSTKRDWSTHIDPSADETISIESADENLQYSFNVPWMFWKFRRVTILDDSELIVMINDRVIILNKDKKEIAFITKAKDYIVRLKK